jgi:hypothetical protein
MVAEDHESLRQMLAQGIFHDELKICVGFCGRQYVAGSLNLHPIEPFVLPFSVQAVGYAKAEVPNKENKYEAQQSDNYAHWFFPKSNIVFSIVKSCNIDYSPGSDG